MAPVIDAEMPERDGVSLASELRGLPGAAGLPVVLLCRPGAERAEGRGRALERVAVVHKPIKRAPLIAALAAVRQPAPAGAAATAAATDDGLPRVPPMRVLMAEDNAFNQRVAGVMLSKLGQSCDMVADGREAVEAVRDRGYAVVFMDMQMPEVDGLEATRQIRAMPLPGRQPYIIALTANALQGDRDRCLEAGMDDYVSKPMRREDLAAALVRASAQVRAG